MKVIYMYTAWKHVCDNNEVIRMCMQAKDEKQMYEWNI